MINIDKRKAAKKSFEKTFYRVLNYAMFGKTKENIRKRQIISDKHTQKKIK